MTLFALPTLPIEEAASPGEYVKNYTRAAGSNFYYSFLLLPRAKREAMFAIYAFCKYTDDLVDEDQHDQDKFELLNEWRAEVEQLYRGQPTHVITRALGDILEDFPIPKKYLHDLIDGMEMDLVKKRYATFDELLLYCYRVASVVGLMSIEVFGYANKKTQQYARDLGIAFQLTNILRDLKNDAERGRIYLPQEDLDRFSYSEEDLIKGQYNRSFIELMRFEVARAKDYFQSAARALPLVDKSTVVASEIMAGIYFRILERIEASNYNVFKGRISLPKPLKMGVALGTWARNKIRL